MTAAPPSRAPVEIGQVLADKYVVEHVLGVGGMGVVVAARHRFLGGRVALKFVLPELAQSAQVAKRFLKEAQAATQITSEHVARVTDVGTLENGAPYMVMEYMEGRDLGAVLAERGGLPVSDVVDYVLQALQAVAEAHSKGIVHRDLKPSNLFLTQRPGGAPLVKVLDFGIAKAVALDASSGAPGADITRTGAMMGSPLYMSPEQIRSSKAVDGRTDVWSVGIILHELLTQNHPFLGDTQGAVLAAILTEPAPPIRRARPDVPEAVERIILGCLEKSLDRRLPNVAAIAERLAPYGSSDARVSWLRIAQISGTRSGSDRSGPLSFAGPMPAATVPSASRAPAPAPAPTTGDWAGTNPGIERPKRRGGGVLIGMAAVVLLAAAAGAALWARGSNPAEASDEVQREAQSAAAQTPIATLPVAPRPPPETAPVAPSPAVIASAIVSAPPQVAPVPAPARAARPTSRRLAVATAPPASPKAPATKKPPSKPKTSEDLDGLIERRE